MRGRLVGRHQNLGTNWPRRGQTYYYRQASCRRRNIRYRKSARRGYRPRRSFPPRHQHPVGDQDGGQPVRDIHRCPHGQDRLQRVPHGPFARTSSDAVASYKINTAGSARDALADPTGCRCPADILPPRLRTSVSKPSGSALMNGPAPMASAAASISALLAVGLPSAMLSATDPVTGTTPASPSPHRVTVRIIWRVLFTLSGGVTDHLFEVPTSVDGPHLQRCDSTRRTPPDN